MKEAFKSVVDAEIRAAGLDYRLSEENLKIKLRLILGDRFNEYEIARSLRWPDNREKLIVRLRQCVTYFRQTVAPQGKSK